MIAGEHALQIVVKDVSKYFMQMSRIQEVFLINFTEFFFFLGVGEEP